MVEQRAAVGLGLQRAETLFDLCALPLDTLLALAQELLLEGLATLLERVAGHLRERRRERLRPARSPRSSACPSNPRPPAPPRGEGEWASSG